MMSDALVQLSGRCEAATGPDVCLAKDIFKAVHPDKVPHTVVHEGYGWREDSAGWWLQTGEDDRVPRKTIYPLNWLASLDAAMTLVPPEHAVDLTIWAGQNRARILPLFQDGDRWLHSGSAPHYCSNAATPALALTAAALRALAKEPTP